MRSIQIVWNHLARRPGVVVLLTMLMGTGMGLADRFPPDPVEELRQALRVPRLGRDLTSRVQALRTLSDMRRALSLQEWRSGTGIEETGAADRAKAQQLLVERFKQVVHNVLKQGSTDERLAVMAMLA